MAQVFPLREKLSHTEVYASGSGRHYRVQYASFVVKNFPAPENLPLLPCVCCYTNDLFAIAKLLV